MSNESLKYPSIYPFNPSIIQPSIFSFHISQSYIKIVIFNLTILNTSKYTMESDVLELYSDPLLQLSLHIFLFFCFSSFSPPRDELCIFGFGDFLLFFLRSSGSLFCRQYQWTAIFRSYQRGFIRLKSDLLL